MDHPQVTISVYPEHFIVSMDYNGQTYEGSGELLSTAFYEIAQELELDEDN